MKLAELKSTLADAVSGGQVGTPVSLRLHLQITSKQTDATGLVAALMPLAETIFAASPQQLIARRNNSAEQLSVLFEYAGGQTCFVTCGAGCATHDSLQLLLFGNRGQIRLEGGELIDAESLSGELASDVWRNRIETSLNAGGPVSIE